MVVVDQLGKMELASPAFCEAVAELLGREVAVVAPSGSRAVPAANDSCAIPR